MRTKIELTLEQLKQLHMDKFVCTSVKVMKYLTLECQIKYEDLVITSDEWTCWIFQEDNTLSKALKNRRNSSLIA